jgi:hypothetical protein
MLCEEDWDYLLSWTPLIEPSNSGALSQVGWTSLRQLGERYKLRYSTLLGRPYDPEDGYNFVHSDALGGATRDSAKAFISGLFGSYCKINDS